MQKNAEQQLNGANEAQDGAHMGYALRALGICISKIEVNRETGTYAQVPSKRVHNSALISCAALQ